MIEEQVHFVCYQIATINMVEEQVNLVLKADAVQ